MNAVQRRVLVADDDEDIRDLVASKLEIAAYNVRTIGNGSAALESIREWKPDLAVLDVMMPGASGVEITRAVRADPELDAVRILLLTARARDSEVDLGYEAGADDYVIKPFSPRELLVRVAAIFGD